MFTVSYDTASYQEGLVQVAQFIHSCSVDAMLLLLKLHLIVAFKIVLYMYDDKF